ncbi:integrase [Clostridioides difficile]|uniref:integrase n=1 Tax=Clostridioides difficile TaxID=1496 RepID=UPI001034F067|nr:integrase [Clostridioides difficile]
MTWDELKKRDVQYIVKYINDELVGGKSLIKISSEVQTSESSIRKYLKKRYYKRINNRFVYVNEECMQKVSEDDESTQVEIVNQKRDTNIQKKLLLLADNYNEIIEIINWYNDLENKNIEELSVQSKDIKIDLPSKNAKRTTIRIIEEVIDLFDEFCRKHSEFTKTDLMSMALLEYMNKYCEESSLEV